MSKRDSYPEGVPCWVVNLQPDPAAATEFYAAVFGWDITRVEAGDYFVARMRGRDVAAIAPLPPTETPVPATWMTHVRVSDVAEAAERAQAAGGTLRAGPMDLSPEGRLAVLADPTGAGFCAWEAGTREGAQLVNEPGAWAMSALQTPDVDAAQAFYKALFGWETETFGPPEAGVRLARLPGYVGGEAEQPVPRDVVAAMMPAQDGPAAWGLDFWIADAEAGAARAAEAGGTVLVEPHEEMGFKRVVLADPAGAAFSASQLLGAG